MKYDIDRVVEITNRIGEEYFRNVSDEMMTDCAFCGGRNCVGVTFTNRAAWSHCFACGAQSHIDMSSRRKAQGCSGRNRAG